MESFLGFTVEYDLKARRLCKAEDTEAVQESGPAKRVFLRRSRT